jgi:2-oxoglutarate/2-oxoacid ferredoxin oxidoreductase subunit alpha
MNEITLAIVGSGGDGAVAAGDILSMACARDGLHVIKTEAYGPQIRGGESSCTVRISSNEIFAQADAIDALVVFNWADFARFASELTLAPNAIVLHEANDAAPDNLAPNAQVIGVPFTATAREAGAPNGKNILATGMIAAILGLPLEAIRAAIKNRFAKKTAAVIEGNLTVFDKGAELAALIDAPSKKFEYRSGAARLVMSGNEASAVGAIEAGCRFFAGYPITPSSEILHFLSEWFPRIGGTCLQTEDELAAIGAVIGGSFAGVKSMTATSGPGLSLMAEMLGLSAIAEIPAVVVNVQRGGPSTGIPTKSEQSDLMHSLYAGHGDMPRAVIGVCDVEDSFHATVEAFNIAEEFQIPVIVLSDQSIAQCRQTLSPSALEHDVVSRRVATPEELNDFKRYRYTDDGISPMSIPGMAGGMFQTNGLEHDERGRPSAMYSVHEKMNEKRYRKLGALAAKYPLFRRYGAEKPQVGVICWGSTTGAVREAINRLTAEGVKVAAFVPRLLMPLPAAQLQAFIDSCEEVVITELSHSKQFAQYLRTAVDLPRNRTHVFARSGGKALGVNEIIDQVRSVVGIEIPEEVLA